MFESILFAVLPTPALPPRRFDIDPPVVAKNAWDASESYFKTSTAEWGMNDTRSSSSPNSETVEFIKNYAIMPRSTSAQSNGIEALAQMVSAEERAISVQLGKSVENLFEIRRLTGFSWESIAGLLSVDRRSVHNWVKGGEIRDKNAIRIADILSTLRFIDRGSVELNVVALTQKNSDGLTALEFLKEGLIENARKAVGPGTPSGRPQVGMVSDSKLPKGLLEFFVHPDASSADLTEQIDVEPARTKRRRTIRRG